MDETEVLRLFETCSNVGRWGPDDGVGTLNLITAEKRLAALAIPRRGTVVPLGHELPIGSSRQAVPSAELDVRYRPAGSDAPVDTHDTLHLSIHGFEVTHLDAPAHVFFEGRAFGGRDAADVAGSRGLAAGSIAPIAERGIVTRGVLLDVAAARGVDHLSPGDGIGVADLETAQARAGVRVESGDAVIVRAGHAIRKAREGEAHDEAAPHEGLLAEVMPWLHERGVAVYGGDCIERRPSGYARVPMPLHQVGLVAMGLCILDVVDVEALASACREEGSHAFLLIASPLRVPGGTGSAVNPLAIL